LPDFFDSWEEDEDIDEDSRYDGMHRAISIGDDDTDGSESYTEIVKPVDTYPTDIYPSYDCSYGKSNRTCYRRDTRKIPSLWLQEYIGIDREEYSPDAPGKCMWNHPPMKYMIDIRDESHEVDDNSEYGEKYLKRGHTYTLAYLSIEGKKHNKKSHPKVANRRIAEATTRKPEGN